ncbi:MAG: YraN family protein [Candidatus Omnitrophica bacterium]|nr:YraN family protein [Candidatus Omnitrophota bacterium]MCM8829345.1 YraN family protein [Candidatus Omnitrophota bacterium]
MGSAREKGSEGEEIAVRFLKANGYRILDRNYRTKYGEIDIVAQKKKVIVFVEVKTRLSNEFGSPAEAVDERKLSRIASVANQYIQKERLDDFSFRFEIVSVTKQNNSWHCEIIPVD